MRSRGLVVVLALILATLATAGVFLYSRGVKENAIEGGDLRDVVVATVDIPANSELNDFIREDQFTVIQVPEDTLIEDPVTEISQLQNQRNSVYIFSNEQIPVARVRGGVIPGGQLSIPEGLQAITVAMDAPRAISGALTGGDDVTIYATFEDITLTAFTEKSLKKAIKAASKPQQPTSTTTSGGAAEQNGQVDLPTFDATVTLVPTVQVLRVIHPTDSGGAVGEETDNPDNSASSTLQVILAMTPEDAQKFVFSAELGTTYLSLLPPDQEGVEFDPTTVAQILLPEGAR